ncbi:phosphoribosylaminoimidazolesuccinocarboxamide synthase [Polaribacter undariae]|uniref:Phosphoribosylaminoimidazolesuccinocarboxamide synthase n=1 Tax=Polaribacter sejongensis TaxID=985043 RepID=A0AAJ1QWK8_9FLAO|nr:phosphoribosylaminoimidazolesuccinocarboxamide synthase [Polaribacter undariae]MDN3619628.1 phosphoribosylaminoimidazolesuccinocarboxamide synthase [Polaribacter undariae]UWD32258.1 phosphoribosylaminoimidazolesuccinocarboxamide synthase [Polaribacter undariae]
MEKQFKTKTGFCHILPDKIILTRDGIIGNMAKVAVGKSITRVIIIYGGISAFLLYSAFDSFQTDQIPMSIFYLIIGLFLMYGIFTSLNNSATPIIERKDITSIKFKKAIFGITRSRFEVLFKDENGKIKKRIIMLPGSLDNGKNETEIAKKIMKEEKLLNE